MTGRILYGLVNLLDILQKSKSSKILKVIRDPCHIHMFLSSDILRFSFWPAYC